MRVVLALALTAALMAQSPALARAQMVEDDAAPTEEGTAPTEEGTAPTEEGTAPTEEDAQPDVQASTPSDHAAGWLARQVTASGALADAAPSEDLVSTATAVLALRQAGWGAGAISRMEQHLQAIVDGRDPTDLSAIELALLITAIVESGGDPTAYGSGPLDTVAELELRRQAGGPDEGLHGSSSPLSAPVRTQSLALRALTAAGAVVPPSSITWLQEQQCPNGGWPLYRDAASRSTDTCEVLAAALDPTAAALAALDVVGLGPPDPDEVESFLRLSQHETGGFSPTPGVRPTPLATAHGLQVMRLQGLRPDGATWAGSAGTPDEVLAAEQLTCDQPAEHRGAWPDDNVVTAPEDAEGEGPPSPAEPAPAQTQPEDEAPSIPEPASTVSVGRILLTQPLAERGPPATASPGARPGDPFPACPVEVVRVSGADRIGTSIALSRVAFPDGAPAVILATSRDYADSLSAAAVAGLLQGPLLLSDPNRVPTSLVNELTRLEPSEIVLMGGDKALSQQVQDAVTAMDGVQTVRRIAGGTRVETAAAAAEEVGTESVFITRGDGPATSAPWADAVSVGPWASAAGMPVLLLTGTGLPPATADALEGAGRAVIIGGQAVISDAVADEISALVPDTTRIAGSGRVSTAAAVFRAARAGGLPVRTVTLVTAADYPDALAAGPASAVMDGLLLLVDPTSGLEDATVDALVSVDWLVDRVVLVGGEGVMADQTGADAVTVVRSGAAG